MKREQLLDRRNKFIKWLNTKPVDAEELGKVMSKEVNMRIPYPGSEPTFDGELEIVTKFSVSAPDFKFTVVESFVDEAENKIFTWLKVTGTHEKYVSLNHY